MATNRPGTLHQPLHERLIGAAGTALAIGLLGAGLLWGLATHRSATPPAEAPLLTLDVTPPPPPPPRIVETPVRHAVKDPAAAPNLRNRATPVVVPPPILRPPAPPPPIIAAPVADLGAAAQTGAADRSGPGRGAGGEGDGTGGGGDDDGSGDIPPRQIKGRLRYSDLPPDMRAAGQGGSVGVRYSVEVDGRVGTCAITRSSGNADLDALTCRLIRKRFRFRPLRTADGELARSNIVETHSWYVDRSEEDRDE